MAFCSVSLGLTASYFLSPSSSFSVSSSHPSFPISLRLCNSNKPSSFSPNSFLALAQKSTNLSPAAAAAAETETETETVVEESTVEPPPPPPPVEVQIAAAASAAAETPKAKGEDVFAVVMIGSRQYIVIPGRFLYVQRLKDANVNDMIVLNKVLLVGTRDKAYIGQPVVTNAAVHALVEEQGLDKKVIVYKYKKKKNYRRNIGHRQPNTRIRITGITGYQDFPAETMPETVP